MPTLPHSQPVFPSQLHLPSSPSCLDPAYLMARLCPHQQAPLYPVPFSPWSDCPSGMARPYEKSPSPPASVSASASKLSPLQEFPEESAGKSTLDPSSSAFVPTPESVQTFPDVSKLSFGDTHSATSSHGSLKKQKSAYGAIGESSSRATALIPTPRHASPASSSTNTQSTGKFTYPSSASPRTPWSMGRSLTAFSPHSPLGDKVNWSSGPAPLPKEKQRQGGINLAMSGGPATHVKAEDLGRYLMITHAPMETTLEDVEEYLDASGLVEYHSVFPSDQEATGTFLVALYDPREAVKVYAAISSGPVRLRMGVPQFWTCLGVDRGILEHAAKYAIHNNIQRLPPDESEIIVQFVGNSKVLSESQIAFLESYGDIMKQTTIAAGKTYRVEYFDARVPPKAIADMRNQQLEDGYVIAILKTDDRSKGSVQPFPLSSPQTSTPSRRSATLGSHAYAPGAFRQWQIENATPQHVRTPKHSRFISPMTPAPAMTPSPWQNPVPSSSTSLRHITHEPYSYPQLTPETRPPLNSQIRITPGVYAYPQAEFDTPRELAALGRRIEDPRVLHGLLNSVDISARVRQGQGIGGHLQDRQRIPEENRVIPQRIISGHDTRTTVMIKDVPNKLSRGELVGILNAVVPGDFDFVYLRFDFHNCCNVGYAFVNFTTVQSLLKFITERVGRKWNMFSSEKVLQMSYANIQGKTALINKFKNSAVMGVVEQWRPQIFYTSGSQKGQPEPFPEADNYAQKMRSLAAVGLSSLSPVGGDVSHSIYNYEYDPAILERGF